MNEDQLAETMLNADWLTHPENTSRENVKNLTRLNQALVSDLGSANTANRARGEAILKKYRSVLLDGCLPGTLTDCRNLKFFRQDSLTYSLAVALAQRETDIRVRFLFYKMAYTLANANATPDLDRDILHDSLTLFQSYGLGRDGNAKTLDHYSQSDRFELRKYADFIALILRAQTSASASDAISLERFNTWLGWTRSNIATTLLGQNFMRAITATLDRKIKDPAAEKALAAEIDASLASAPTSYINTLNRLKKQPDLLQNFHLDPLPLSDWKAHDFSKYLTYYYLDQIFRMHASSDEAFFWQNADQSAETIVRILSALIKTSLLDQALTTHQDMGRFFSDLIKRGEQKELFDRTFEHADAVLTPSWKAYNARVRRLRTFFESQIEPQFLGANTTVRSVIQQGRDLFNDMTGNIKYLVTYPDLLMMSYYAAKVNFQETIASPWGSVHVDSQKVLSSIMAGDFPPLFTFTDDDSGAMNRKKLDPVEMLWSLNYAMKMDLPKLFGVDTGDFLKEFLTTYKSDTDQKLQDWNDRLGRWEISSTSGDGTRDALEKCQLMKNAPDRNYLWPQPLGNFNRLKGAAFYGHDSRNAEAPYSSLISKIDLKGNALRGSLDELLETVRSDVDPLLRNIRLLQTVLESTASASDKTLISGLLNDTLTVKKRDLELATSLINQSTDCILRFTDIESRRRIELFHMEGAFLDDVYNAMVAVKAHPENIHAINSQLIDGAYDSRFFSLNPAYDSDYNLNSGVRVDANGDIMFVARPRDFALRLATYLTLGYKNTELSYRPDAVQIDFPRSMKTLINMTREFSMNQGRAFALPDGGSKGETDRARFKTAVLQYLFSNLSWFGNERSMVTAYRSLIRLKTALYKYELTSSDDPFLTVSQNTASNQKFIQQIDEDSHQLIQLSVRIANQLSLKPEEKQILQTLGLISEYQPTANQYIQSNGPNLLFVRETNGFQYLGIADDAFTDLTSIRLGFDPVFRGLRPTAEATWLHQSNLNFSNTPTRINIYQNAADDYVTLRDYNRLRLFPLPASMDRVIKSMYEQSVKNDLLIAQRFIQVCRDEEQNGSLPQMHFSLMKPADTQPVLLDNSLVLGYQSQIEQFHQSTDGVFR